MSDQPFSSSLPGRLSWLALALTLVGIGASGVVSSLVLSAALKTGGIMLAVVAAWYASGIAIADNRPESPLMVVSTPLLVFAAFLTLTFIVQIAPATGYALILGGACAAFMAAQPSAQTMARWSNTLEATFSSGQPIANPLLERRRMTDRRHTMEKRATSFIPRRSAERRIQPAFA